MKTTTTVVVASVVVRVVPACVVISIVLVVSREIVGCAAGAYGLPAFYYIKNTCCEPEEIDGYHQAAGVICTGRYHHRQVEKKNDVPPCRPNLPRRE